jgi:glutamate-1-semialdehyde 2,1-aminomutase
LPKEGYLKALREICDDNGIVLIFDEVINGFRISTGGAQKLYNIMPDLTTLGKIIGGGLPVGAYGGKAEIMAHISPDGPVYQAGTLSGNPLAMNAGIASLKQILDSDFHKNLEEMGQYFEKRIREAIEPFKGKVLFNRIASIFTFSFTDQMELNSLDDVKKCDMSLFGEFHGAMLEEGIYLAPSGYEVGFLSSAHSKEDLDKTVRAVETSLENIL